MPQNRLMTMEEEAAIALKAFELKKQGKCIFRSHLNTNYGTLEQDYGTLEQENGNT